MTYQKIFEKQLTPSDNGTLTLTEAELDSFNSVLSETDRDCVNRKVPLLFLVDDLPLSDRMWCLECTQRIDRAGEAVFHKDWKKLIREKEWLEEPLPVIILEWCGQTKRMKITKKTEDSGVSSLAAQEDADINMDAFVD